MSRECARMSRLNRLLTAATLCGGLALGASPSLAQVPAVQSQNGISYITGGIGSDESEALKGAMKDYPLALIFARPQEGGAAYLSDVWVAIQDGRGKPVLNATAEGPYLLVKLPPGRYTVSAETGGEKQQHMLEVRTGKTTQQRFDWRK